MSKKISELAAAASLDGTEAVPVVQAGATVKTTVDQIAARAGASTIGHLNGINDQAGTSYTLAASDAGKDVRCTNAASITLNIDTQANSGIAVGFWALVSQGGAGIVTVTALTGVTLRAPNGAATAAQYDARGIEYLGGDEWRVW